MEVKIIDMDHLGNGIAKDNNKVIFVPKTVTDDICDIDIYKKYKISSNSIIYIYFQVSVNVNQ